MDVDLDLVLIVFEGAKDSQSISNSDLVVAEPRPDLGLTLASLTVVVAIVVEPEYASHYTCRVVQTEEMLVIFLDVEDYSSCQLDLGEQVEISENEEDLALSFKLSDHELLKREQVVVLVLVSIVGIIVDVAAILKEIVLAVLAISEREHIVAALDHKQREVQVRELEVNVADLTRCLNLGLWSLVVPVEMLA